MLILGVILFGLLVGWLAQFVLNREGERTDWTMAIVAGLGGSIVGALVITAACQRYAKRQRSGSSWHSVPVAPPMQ